MRDDSLFPFHEDCLIPGTFRYIFSHLPELATERLVLRRLKMRDATDFFAYASDPEVARFVLWEPHKSISETRAVLHRIIRRTRRGEPATFAITLPKSGRMIGTIGFMWVDTDSRSAEIGYSLNRAYWNRGYMTEALSAVLDFAFDVLRLNRVEAQYETDNPASGRVMAHCGMRYEGTMRQRLRNKGRYIDVAVCAILQSDRTNIITKGSDYHVSI